MLFISTFYVVYNKKYVVRIKHIIINHVYF